MNDNPNNNLNNNLNNNVDPSGIPIIKNDDKKINQQKDDLKNNALFNLDFNEYKKHVKDALNEQQNKLSELDYTRDLNEIQNKDNNIFLFIGLTFIIIAIIFIILN